jgi:hypothetical protein
MNKCPSCSKTFTNFRAEPVNADLAPGSNYASLRVVSFQCPHCRVVLGVSPDPIAMRTDIVNAVKR